MKEYTVLHAWHDKLHVYNSKGEEAKNKRDQ